jgi:hypothetical protein
MRNAVKDRAICRRWREKNPDKVRDNNARWRREHPEVLRTASRNWKARNAEQVRAYNKKWHEDNPGKHGEYNKKRRSSLKGKLTANISVAICNSLAGNKNGWHWETLVGYTLADLKKHLEKQFHSGMSWENYGKWHIDHRIPIAAFNFETPFDLDFRQCWALRNLRPLWAGPNMSKKDKVARPFQPSLLLKTTKTTK